MADQDPLQPASGSEHPLPDDRALLDWDAALQLTQGDMGVLCELIELFHTQLPVLLEEARAAIATEDPETLRRAAHTLKGSTGVFQGQRATEAALALEMVAKERQLATAEPLLLRLEHETRLLLAALQKRVDAQHEREQS